MTIRRERGMSMMGMMFLLVAVILVVTMALRIVPHYMTNATVNDLVDGLTPQEVQTGGRTQLMETLEKRFKINSIYDLDPKEIIHYERDKGAVKVSAEYEVREPLVGNAYILLLFRHERTF